ncbi:hypothetical protein MMF93_25565 [Streptomyces tubbatahanensis]|uniref:Lipoprotein n=1 Tax=Streptomyces tubbatahanensis TaxID=2923272 RepID=A0ABY3XY80_9ACTN|nr:hypothetical protein [Streptomyces tubbatahanensis]UNS99446.1 hypothetical protein MMF93_25565 [Streptomyces tubbatahanensis]
MTPLGSRATAATTALALTLTLALTAAGCGLSGGDGDGGDNGGGKQRAHAAGSSPAPDPTGSGTSSAPASPDAHTPPPSPSESETALRGGTPKGDVPKPGDVDQTDADAVGKGTLTAMWTFDTTVDQGPQDAGTRTADAGWLTPSYARQLSEHRPRSAPGAQWATWKRHRAYTTVELAKTEDAAKPDDTDTVAWRQWTLTTTPHGRDGWTQKPTAAAAFVHLVRKKADAEWHVADVTVR